MPNFYYVSILEAMFRVACERTHDLLIGLSRATLTRQLPSFQARSKPIEAFQASGMLNGESTSMVDTVENANSIALRPKNNPPENPRKTAAKTASAQRPLTLPPAIRNETATTVALTYAAVLRSDPIVVADKPNAATARPPPAVPFIDFTCSRPPCLSRRHSELHGEGLD